MSGLLPIDGLARPFYYLFDAAAPTYELAPIDTHVSAPIFPTFVRSEVGAWLGMPLQIPARCVSGAWKQRVDTGSHLRRIKDELGLATFLRHRVVGHHGDLSKGMAVRRHAMAEHDIVHGIGDPGHAQRGREPDDHHSLQEMLESGSQR
jgi:hypothetical protein